MLERIGAIFAPPVFSKDEDKTRKARYTNVIALALMFLALVYEVVLRLFADYRELTFLDLIMLLVAVTCVISLSLLKRGSVRLAAILLVVLTWLATNSLAATGFGARDSSFILNFAIVLMAGLLLGWQAALIVTGLSIGAGFVLAYAEQNGAIRAAPYPVTGFARDIAFVFVLNVILMFLLIRGLESALRKSRSSLAELEGTNANLSAIQEKLQSRTDELILTNQELETRTRKLQAIAAITRTAASIRSLERLLASITTTIGRQLGYEQVALLLLDAQQENAILRSIHVETGDGSLRPEFRISLKQGGPLAFVAKTGQAQQIVPSTSELAILQTRHDGPAGSEIALPLRSADEVIGVLDIQAQEENAFSKADLSILTILADQVAITIRNLILYEQSQRALQQVDESSAELSSGAWKRFKNGAHTRGYRYDGIRSEPLRDTRNASGENGSLQVPIQLRGHTIASFDLKPADSSRPWSDDELMMVKATAERVALAIEGARLLEEAHKRAAREAFLSDIATKLSASFQLDSILRDTVQELGQTLRNATVTFQLVNPGESGMEGANPIEAKSGSENNAGASDG